MAHQLGTHELLFPPLPAASFDRELISAMTISRYQTGDRFSAHCCQRGAAQELELDVSTNDTAKGAGFWRGVGFKSYVAPNFRAR